MLHPPPAKDRKSLSPPPCLDPWSATWRPIERPCLSWHRPSHLRFASSGILAGAVRFWLVVAALQLLTVPVESTSPWDWMRAYWSDGSTVAPSPMPTLARGGEDVAGGDKSPGVAPFREWLSSVVSSYDAYQAEGFENEPVHEYKGGKKKEKIAGPISEKARSLRVLLRGSGSIMVTPTAVVDCKGDGDYKTINAALKALRDKNFPQETRKVLYIKGCTYSEKVLVPITMARLTLKGENAYTVFISWNDTAGKQIPGPVKGNTTNLGTFNSGTVTVEADYFVAEDISFVNTVPEPTPDGPAWAMGVAYRVTADFVAHYNCRFFGWQDTLYDHAGRHYFFNCYIQGSVDFIFGNGASIYERCTLFSLNGGYITAHKRIDPDDKTGYVVLRSKILGYSQTHLGRAWGDHSRVIYAFCYLDRILPDAWDDFGTPKNRKTVFYGEYKNTGPGSVQTRRNNWTYILSDKEAAPFISYSFINTTGWLGPIPSLTATPPFYAPPYNTAPKKKKTTKGKAQKAKAGGQPAASALSRTRSSKGRHAKRKRGRKTGMRPPNMGGKPKGVGGHPSPAAGGGRKRKGVGASRHVQRKKKRRKPPTGRSR